MDLQPRMHLGAVHDLRIAVPSRMGRGDCPWIWGQLLRGELLFEPAPSHVDPPVIWGVNWLFCSRAGK